MTAYKHLNAVVQGKIQILKEEPYLEKVIANTAIHYKKPTIDKAMAQIITENPNFDITYRIEINSVFIEIQLSK